MIILTAYTILYTISYFMPTYKIWHLRNCSMPWDGCMSTLQGIVPYNSFLGVKKLSYYIVVYINDFSVLDVDPWNTLAYHAYYFIINSSQFVSQLVYMNEAVSLFSE